MEFDSLPREELIALLKDATVTIQSIQGVADALRSEVVGLKLEIVDLKQEVDRLKGDPPTKPGVPAFVKANAEPQPKMPRKKRAKGFGRCRQEPTQTITHMPETCTCSGRKLTGGWVHRTREVIELPSTPVRIIEHQIMAARCGVCGKRVIASVDLSDTVIGQSRVGIRLMSVIAYLDTVCRMPVRAIQRLLKGLYSLHLSVGEICKILRTVATKGKATYDGLHKQLQSSEVVNGDETGWRQNGKNGYVWSFSTPDLHYFLCQRNRSGDVVREALTSAFTGTLVTDFYSAYHYYRGPHQYCWPHLLRDIHALKEKHAKDPLVIEFGEKVKQIYDEAKLYTHPSVFARQRKRRCFEDALCEVARNHLGPDRPERVLAERILKRIHGLFVFVEKPKVPSNNNAAERALRPIVVLRKVSGGTRSDSGSQTVEVLMSLFATWQARNQDALQTCRLMLMNTGNALGPGAVGQITSPQM